MYCHSICQISETQIPLYLLWWMFCLQVNAPGCIPDEDCGSKSAAVFFFCSFYLMVAFVFLNLFIGRCLFYASVSVFCCLLCRAILLLIYCPWWVLTRFIMFFCCSHTNPVHAHCLKAVVCSVHTKLTCLVCCFLIALLPLLVPSAVLVENFSLFYSSDEDALLSTRDLQDFKAKWDILDRSRSVSSDSPSFL